MDFIVGMFGQLIWPIIIALLGLIGFLGYGAKKKADGRKAERERARDAREAAAKNAVVIRDKAAAKPIDKQRKGVEEWEQ